METSARTVVDSIDAMSELTKRLIDSGAESVVLISPHAPLEVDSFVAYEGPEVCGDFSNFHAPDTYFSATVDEVTKFFKALNSVGRSPDWNVTASRSALIGIRIGTGVGNSFQDLHLSLYGFKLGILIRKTEITSRSEAAQWLRTDLGASVSDETPSLRANATA